MDFKAQASKAILETYGSFESFIDVYYEKFVSDKEMKLIYQNQTYIFRIHGSCNLYIQGKDFSGVWVELNMFSDH